LIENLKDLLNAENQIVTGVPKIREAADNNELEEALEKHLAAEARAKIVYERLIQFTEDVSSIRALQFLITREITHMKLSQRL
jgi:ferritin-like metal-binding protein YciE